MSTTLLEQQTWWSVARAHAAVLVRPGGIWPVLLGCLAAAEVASLVLHAVLPEGSSVVRPAGAMPLVLALAAGSGVHAGWWCQSGAFEEALALVPDRRRLLVGQVVGTALVVGATATVGAGVLALLTRGFGSDSTLSGLPYVLVAGLMTAALTAQAVALGVLCRHPVLAGIALGVHIIVLPVLLTSVRTWLEGVDRVIVDALIDTTPAQLAISGLGSNDVATVLGGILGQVAWAIALTALTWSLLIRRDH